MHHRRIPVLAVALVVPLIGCERPTAPNAPADIHAWVVGEAARSLDIDGRFVLPPPAPPGSEPITTVATATVLAETFLTMFTAPSTRGIGGITIADDLERQRGAAIAFPDLVSADRTYYAESPYLPVADSVPPALRKYLGPFFLVPLLDRGEPAVVVASSAYNTDIGIVADRLVFPPGYGNDFWWAAIPAGTGFLRPITPEHAVEVVWRATGQRVNRVPHLIGPGRLYFPHWARWRISLENPVRVQGIQTGRQHTTSELYVSAQVGSPEGQDVEVRVQIEIALPEQPQLETLGYPCQSDREVDCELLVELRRGFPVDFEAVRVVR